MNGRAFVSVFVLLWALSACDAVGAELVDETGPIAGLPRLPCVTPPICHAVLPPVVEKPDKPLPPVDFAHCLLTHALPCAPEEPAFPKELEPLDLGWLVGCSEEPWPVSHAEPYQAVPCRRDARAADVECSTLTIDGPTAAEDLAERHFDQPVWSGVEVLIRSSQPFDVILDRAWLFDVSITLEGPVRLRIVDTALLSWVRVRTIEAGTGRLLLDRVDGSELRVGTSDKALAQVQLEHSKVTHVQVAAKQVEMESVSLRDGRTEGQALLGLDAHLSEMELGTDTTTLSSFTMQRVQLTRCDVLTLIDGKIEDCQFAPCTMRAARFYDTDVRRGVFDGTAESDRTAWGSVTLGARAPTQITAWGSGFSSVAMCPLLETLRFGGSSTLSCASCPDGTPDEPARPADTPREGQVECDPFADLTGPLNDRLCTVPDPMEENQQTADVNANYCDLGQAIPQCPTPYPERTRPPPPTP